jgi:hypothetical protein
MEDKVKYKSLPESIYVVDFVRSTSGVVPSTTTITDDGATATAIEC